MSPTSTSLLQAALLWSLVAFASAQFTSHSKMHRTIVQSYGSSEKVFSAYLKLPKHDRLVSAHLVGIDRRIATRVFIHPVRTGSGYNLTCTIEMEGKLGHTAYTLVAKTAEGRRYTMAGSVDVIGVRFAKHVVRQTKRTTAISAQVYAGKNAPPVRLTDCRLAVSGRDAFLGQEDVAVKGNTLVLKPTSRLGKSAARISVDCPGIGADGESAENELSIEPDVRLLEEVASRTKTT